MVQEVRLYNLPLVLEKAAILEDSILPLYCESVMLKYNSAKARETLLKFNRSLGSLIESNPPMLIHLHDSGLLGDQRLATRTDLEKAAQHGLLLGGNYVDVGIALRGEECLSDINRASAEKLVNQLKKRGIKLGKGRLIPFSVLTQKEDPNSGYGLTLDFKEDAILDLPMLGDFKWDWTSTQGITRACLYTSGNFGSDDDRLALSNDCGRVVVVRPELSIDDRGSGLSMVHSLGYDYSAKPKKGAKKGDK